MKMALLISALLLLASQTVRSQGSLPVYGKLSELENLRKVYVSSDLDTARERILHELARYDRLQVVDSPDEAEFFLVYVVKSRTEESTLSQLSAVIKTPEGKERLLWREEESHDNPLSKPNSTNLARHFVKALKKLRKQN